MSYRDPREDIPDLSGTPLPSPYPKPRYVPLGQNQEQRLIDMLELDAKNEYYQHVNMADFHLMEGLRKRGYTWLCGNGWFLSDTGKAMAKKLVVVDDDGLPF